VLFHQLEQPAQRHPQRCRQPLDVHLLFGFAQSGAFEAGPSYSRDRPIPTGPTLPPCCSLMCTFGSDGSTLLVEPEVDGGELSHPAPAQLMKKKKNRRFI